MKRALFAALTIVVAYSFHATAFAATQGFASVSGTDATFGDYFGTQPGGTYQIDRYSGAYPSTGSLIGTYSCSGSGCDMAFFLDPNTVDLSVVLGVSDGDYWVHIVQGANDYYYEFTLTGGTWSTPSGAYGATRITWVEPYNDETVATSTVVDLEAIGIVNTVDTPDLTDPDDYRKIVWEISPVLSGCSIYKAVFNPGCLYYKQTIQEDISFITNDTQSFLISSSTTPTKQNQVGDDNTGLYRMNTSLVKPRTILGASSFFGLTSFGETTLTATSTFFTVGTSTQQERAAAGLENLSLIGTTTEALLQGCLPIPGYWNAYDCTQGMFSAPNPPQYSDLWGSIARKPPFGYFTVVQLQLSTATTTATSTVATPAFLAISLWLAPLINGIGLILWVLAAVWAFKRISKFDFQS